MAKSKTKKERRAKRAQRDNLSGSRVSTPNGKPSQATMQRRGTSLSGAATSSRAKAAGQILASLSETTPKPNANSSLRNSARGLKKELQRPDGLTKSGSMSSGSRGLNPVASAAGTVSNSKASFGNLSPSKKRTLAPDTKRPLVKLCGRPTKTSGNGGSRPFIPWEKKC